MTFLVQTHFLVAFSYLVFRGRGTRGAQAVFLLAIGLPVLFASLPSTTLPPLPVMETALPAIVKAVTLRPTPVATHGAGSADIVESRRGPDLALLSEIALALLVGFALLRLSWRFRGLHRCLAETIPLRRIGRVIVAVSTTASVPFSTRAKGRAWVVLPESLGGRAADFRIAILHELEHHRRGDTRWAMSIEWIVALGFPNPFFTLWKRRIEELQEYSCDEALVGHGRVDPQGYGSCLLRVAETALGSRFRPVGTTGMAAGSGNPKTTKSQLRRRVEMLSTIKSRRRNGAVLTSLFAAAVVTVAAYGARQLPASDDEIRPGSVDFDPVVQKIAEKALAAALERHGAMSGFAVVSEPGTGRLLAVANTDRRKWMYQDGPWALAMRVEPASVMKAFVAAAAVEKGVTTTDETFSCENGDWAYAGRRYKDWRAFDKLTTAETVIHSSNVCGIKIAAKLGAARLAAALREFGFGVGGTASEFPGARPGLIPGPSSDSDEEYVAEVGTGVSGVYLTPLEVVQAMGAIANGGRLLKPIPRQSKAAKEIRRVLSETNAKRLREVLANVMVSGTAKEQQGKKYKLAGKTGSAVHAGFWDHPRLGGSANVASFAGFAPVVNPRIVIYVTVHDPTDDQPHGSSHAGPVFREIAEAVLSSWGV